jgi:DNA-binding transcriptional MocR family regulator
LDFETTVKLRLYRTIAETTRVPDAAELARALDASTDQVEAAFRALSGKRLLVLEPGTASRIRMAPPFSAVETPFLVRVGEMAYSANCVWDALGVSAALHRDARVFASDGHTGEPLDLEVRGGKPVARPCAIHFAVPAARWWDDIIHT